jgi:hypothetical protein
VSIGNRALVLLSTEKTLLHVSHFETLPNSHKRRPLAPAASPHSQGASIVVQANSTAEVVQTMKSDALEVRSSNVEVSTQPVNIPPTDFPTVLFEHAQMRAISPKGLTNKEKLIALTAAELRDEFDHQRQHRSAPERMFRLAFLQRVFGNGQTTVVLPSSGGSGETAPKSLWRDWNASKLLPVAVAVMIALAAWRTGETKSWKGVSDAKNELVSTVKEQLSREQQENKELKAKNEALQDDINSTLKGAADQKQDIATLTDKLNQLLKKYKGTAPVKEVTATAQSPTQGGTQ